MDEDPSLVGEGPEDKEGPRASKVTTTASVGEISKRKGTKDIGASRTRLSEQGDRLEACSYLRILLSLVRRSLSRDICADVHSDSD